MYYVVGAVLAGYLILYVLSRRKKIPEDILENILAEKPAGIRLPFLQMGYFLQSCLLRSPKLSLGRKKVQKQLEKLNPYKNGEVLAKAYFTKKSEMLLMILLFGTILGGLLKFQTDQASVLDGNVVHRGSYRQDPQQIFLEADMEGAGNMLLEMEVSGQMPERAEADELEQLFWADMCRIIPGDNGSLGQVWKDLNLSEKLEGYPFRAEWSSARPDILDDYGWVGTLKEGEEETVLLSANIYWGNWEWKHELEVTVISPPETEDEKLRQEFESYIRDSEEQSRGEKDWDLPPEWEGRSVSWAERQEDNSLLLWGLAAAAGAAVFFLGDRDLETKLAEKQRRMKETYPVIVSKLVLYLGAGMNVKGALLRIAEGYKQNLKRGGKEDPAYEELVFTCREMQTGIPEAAAYEYLGKRSGIQEFVRLGVILSQNLKKGNKALLGRLQEEADRTRREQMNYFRQRGEMVSTKLLVPMVMMLGIVMVMILIPAFGSF